MGASTVQLQHVLTTAHPLSGLIVAIKTGGRFNGKVPDAHVLLGNIRGTEFSLQVTLYPLTTLILHYVDIHRKQQNLTYSSAAPGNYSQLAKQKTQSKYTISVHSQVHVSFV